MGITSGVILGLLLLLPGISFVLCLTKLYSKHNPTTLLDDQVSLGVILSAFFALTFHFVAIVVLNPILHHFHQPTIMVGEVFALLGGQEKSPLAALADESINEYPVRIGSYFLFLTSVAGVAGRLLNRELRQRSSASWFEILRPPEEVTFIWLTADIEMGGDCYLFAGEVLEFSVSKEGDLERVVLRGAVKSPLRTAPDVAAREAEPDPKEVAKGWIEIPGEFVVLQMSQAKTVNVDYFYVVDDTERSIPPPGSAIETRA